MFDPDNTYFISNARSAPDQKALTISDLKATMDQINREAFVNFCPNPCDVGPLTYEALKAKCKIVSASDMTEPQRIMADLLSVEFHIRPGIAEGVIHPCSCREMKVLL